jgi:hypothetical protein
MMETLLQSLQGIFILLPLLISVAAIIAAFAVAIAIWRGMKAQERMADSMERIGNHPTRAGRRRRKVDEAGKSRTKKPGE